MKPSLMLRLAALLSRRRIVWLKDFDDEVRFSLAYTTPWGICAYVHPIIGVGQCLLRSDGKCAGPAIYVKEWRYWEGTP